MADRQVASRDVECERVKADVHAQVHLLRLDIRSHIFRRHTCCLESMSIHFIPSDDGRLKADAISLAVDPGFFPSLSKKRESHAKNVCAE